jgi:hypothetical protein
VHAGKYWHYSVGCTNGQVSPFLQFGKCLHFIYFFDPSWLPPREPPFIEEDAEAFFSLV